MRPWVRYRRGRARYSGAIGRAPFAAWLETPEGQATLDAAASQTRIRFFARGRAARRLWRILATAARDPHVVATIQQEADAYLGRLQELAYAEGLPRLTVDLHRLVVVPRVLLNGAAYDAIIRRLRVEPAFAPLDRADALRQFFVRTIVDQLDRAVAAATPSVKRPLAAGRDWISVGVDGGFVWRLPLQNEPDWNGHHYVLELTRDDITRRVRKAVAAAVARIETSLPSLSRAARYEILRRAAHGSS